MAVIDIAPIVTKRLPRTRALAIPTGTYYCAGTPSVETVLELIRGGFHRIVFTAIEPAEDWDEAHRLLLREGIEIDAHFN